MTHLAYCDDKAKVLDKILEGSKTAIIRAAAGRKIPHSRVFEGEVLYFIQKGSGQITAKATVSRVQNFVKLNEDEINQVFETNASALNLTAAQRKRWHKKCLCIVEFDNVESIEAKEFDRQGNMDDWLIIEKIEDVVKGTSIPYNYDKSKFKKS